jgi:hypothetical protein
MYILFDFFRKAPFSLSLTLSLSSSISHNLTILSSPSPFPPFIPLSFFLSPIFSISLICSSSFFSFSFSLFHPFSLSPSLKFLPFPSVFLSLHPSFLSLSLFPFIYLIHSLCFSFSLCPFLTFSHFRSLFLPFFLFFFSHTSSVIVLPFSLSQYLPLSTSALCVFHSPFLPSLHSHTLFSLSLSSILCFIATIADVYPLSHAHSHSLSLSLRFSIFSFIH